MLMVELPTVVGLGTVVDSGDKFRAIILTTTAKKKQKEPQPFPDTVPGSLGLHELGPFEPSGVSRLWDDTELERIVPDVRCELIYRRLCK